MSRSLGPPSLITRCEALVKKHIKRTGESSGTKLYASWNKNQPIKKGKCAKGKKNSSWPKTPPHLSNLVVHMVWYGLDTRGCQWNWHIGIDVTANKSNMTKVELYRNTAWTQMLQNSFHHQNHFIIQQGNDPAEHTAKPTKVFLGEELEYPRVTDSNTWFQPDWAAWRAWAAKPAAKTIDRKTRRRSVSSFPVFQWPLY